MKPSNMIPVTNPSEVESGCPKNGAGPAGNGPLNQTGSDPMPDLRVNRTASVNAGRKRGH